MLCTGRRVFREPRYNVPISPATFFLQYEWKIPVIQCYPRFNSLFYTIINDPVIKIDPFFVHRTSSGGQDPWPRNGKPEIWNVHFFDQINISRIFFIEITGYFSMMPAAYFSFFCCKCVPYRGSFYLCIAASFYLKGGCRHPPLKIIAKLFFMKLFLCHVTINS